MLGGRVLGEELREEERAAAQDRRVVRVVAHGEGEGLGHALSPQLVVDHALVLLA